eukprot:COSAG02_NODE_1334_length_13206_cov_8.144427_11_plen_1389_part_00
MDSAHIVAFVLSHVNLVSHRLAGLDSRAPICVDVSAVSSLVELFQAYCGDDLLQSDAEACVQRQVCHILMRLLRINILAMSAARLAPSGSSAELLQQLLTRILAIDFVKHEDCASLAEPAADLFSVSQQFFLKTPDAKIRTLAELTDKLLSSQASEEPSTGPTSSSGGLEPVTWAEDQPQIDGQPAGTLRFAHVKKEKSATTVKPRSAKAQTVMTTGKHYLEVRVADDSAAASERNPQGFAVAIGVGRPNVDLETSDPPQDSDAFMYDPLLGRLTGLAAGHTRTSRVLIEDSLAWFGDDWWKSQHSVTRFDTAGMLLDYDTGEIFAMKNRKVCGIVATGLSGEMVWLLTLRFPGTSVEVHSVQITRADEILGMQRIVPTSACASAGAILERLAASVVSEMAKPSSLIACKSCEGSLEVLGSLLKLLERKIVHSCTAPRDVPVDSEGPVQHNAWAWSTEKKHRSFQISDGNRMARRVNGSRPDYAGILGDAGFSAGVHEWDCKLSGEMMGIWFGVASGDMPLGSDESPQSWSEQQARIWFFRPSGRYGSNCTAREHTSEHSHEIRAEQTFRLRLDCDEGSIALLVNQGFQTSSSETQWREAAKLGSVSGEVFPFMYFDYETQVQLIDTCCPAVPISTAPPKVLTADLLISAPLRAVQLSCNEHNPADVTRSVAMVQLTLQFTQQMFTVVKQKASSAQFETLQRSQLQPLLNASLALATNIIKLRTSEGRSAAALLVGPIVNFVTTAQECADSHPDMLMDPSNPVRVASRTFAGNQGCDEQTAAYYVYGFGGRDGCNLKQAQDMYEKCNKQHAPPGWCTPVDEHWLSGIVDIATGLGGKCVATLCSGLKNSEEGFDVSLFAERVQVADVDSIIETVDVSGLKQRWIGFSSPELKAVEELALLAIAAHSGLLQCDMAKIEIQGKLLHAAKEALKVKDAVQAEYRKLASTEQKSSWQAVAEGALSRARLLLEYSDVVVTVRERKMIIPKFEDALRWVQENAATDPVCLRIDACRRFLQNDAVLCSEVTRVLEARSQCVEEAELGYSSAIELLQAGESSRRERQSISRETDAMPPNAMNAPVWGISGLWTFDVKVTDAVAGKEIPQECDYEFACTDEFVFGSSVAGIDKIRDSRMVELVGRLLPGKSTSSPPNETKLAWAELVGHQVAGYFEASLSADETGLKMTGTGETVDAQKKYTFSARLKRPGLAIDKVYAADAEGKPTPHPSLAGISLTRRRCGLLQAAAQAFETMGPLSEHRVQITSDKLSKVALDLLTSDPTENVKLWAGRLLLTRLDDGGTRFLACAEAMKQVLEHATTAQSYCSPTVQSVQGALASVLLSKLASLGSSESALLCGYVGAIMQILRSGSKLNHQTPEHDSQGILNGDQSLRYRAC